MPARTRLDSFNCSLAQALDLVGDWWTLLIVRDAAVGATRFGQFQASLGIAKNILSDRLVRLLKGGLMLRLPDGSYLLSEKGLDLLPALMALMQWGDRWLLEQPPVIPTDSEGRPIDPVSLTVGGAPVHPALLRFNPGPGATDRTRGFLAQVGVQTGEEG